MAYYQARSGVCRSGVTYCGWTPPSVVLKINGTDRTSSVLDDQNFVLNLHADGTPSTLTFTLKTITPTVGQDVALFFAGPNDYLFAGTLLQAEAVAESAKSNCIFWHCTAVGYQWLMDRYDRVLATYTSVGVGTMVSDILYRFTDGGFRVGYIPSSLGNLTMEFTFETITSCLTRIAKAATAFWRVGPFDGTSRIVDMYSTYPETNPATVTESSMIAISAKYDLDLTQVRTRTLVQGTGSSVSSAVSFGSTTIPVDDASIFLTAGGSALAGHSLVTYSGLTLATGDESDPRNPPAGTLTGVSGLLDDLAQGDTVDIIVTTVDSAAETALATSLGGGLSGQATNYISGGNISANEASNRGAADMAICGTSLKDVNYTYKQTQRWLRVGQSVTMSVTSPTTISGSFRIQSVQWKPYKKFGGTNTDVFQSVQASGYVRTMTDLLSTLPG